MAMKENTVIVRALDKKCTERLSSPEEKPKRKRRKVTKSCAFCRRRKLRCDQQRPLCSTCAARGFTHCEYLNDPVGSGNDPSLATPEAVNYATLKDDLNRLEREGAALREPGHKTRYVSFSHEKSAACESLHIQRAVYHITENGDPLPNTRNILNNFFTLQCKKSGRRIYYGATSFKTFMAKYNWELMQRFVQAWSKLKSIRVQMKKESDFSMLKELTVAEEVIENPSNEPTSMISDLTEQLPTRETILSRINHFFDNDQLFVINGILDRNKVLRDFEEGFITGDPRTSDGEAPIVLLKPSLKKNYYKIGVIVMLLALTHYRGILPSAVERFLISLTGCSTAKVMYVERAQFLALRCHCRSIYAHTGGDNSHLMLLVDNMVSTGLFLGLNHHIPTLYEGQENDVGDLKTLQRLWYWTLFFDLDISLNMGRPLRVSPCDYDDSEMLSDHSKTFYGTMKRFLKVTRPMLLDLYSKKIAPDLPQYCETLIDFIEQEFPPLDSYSAGNKVLESGFKHARILCKALDILITFYGLRLFALKEFNTSVKHGTNKAILVSFSLCVSLTLFCFESDKVAFPELVEAETGPTTPYLSACIEHISSLCIRSIGMFYAVAYYEMTFFQNGLLLVPGYEETPDCDMSTLRWREGPTIGFGNYFKIACEKLELLTGSSDPDFKKILRRSQGYVVLLGLTTVLRTVIQTVLQSRTLAENSWLTSSRKLTGDGKLAASPQRKASTTFSREGNVQPDYDMTNSPKIMPKNDATLTVADDYDVDDLNVKTEVDIGPDGFPHGQPMVKLSDQMESEMAQLIEEEFWGNYNMGWQELLDNTDLESVFPDYVL